MTNLKLDLHGFRHHEVPLKVENFLYLNQENMPILIICGNSQKMINIVKDVLEGIDCCLLYTSPSPRDAESSRMPSSA